MAEANIDIRYVGFLARLELTDGELDLLGGQLKAVLSYMDKLNELELDAIEPMAHAVPLVNVARPDQVRPSLTQSEALRNAPAQADGLFMVPRIVE